VTNLSIKKYEFLPYSRIIILTFIIWSVAVFDLIFPQFKSFAFQISATFKYL